MKTFFLEIYRGNKNKFLKILFWTTLSGFTGGIGIMMLVPMLTVLEISSENSGMTAKVLDGLSFLTKGQMIVGLLGIYFLLVTMKALVSAKLSIWDTELVQEYTKKLRMDFYDAVTNADWQKFKSYKRSELSNYFLSETSRVSYATTIFIRMIHLGITTVINVIIAMVMSVRVTLLVLMMGGLFFMLFRNIRRKAKEQGTNIQRMSARFYEEVDNQMNGIKEIRGYGIEKQQAKAFETVVNEYKEISIDYAKLSIMPSTFLAIGSAIAVVVVFILAYLVFKMSIARIAVMVYVLGRLLPSFSTAQKYSQQLLTSLPVYENMRKVVSDLQGSRIAAVDADTQLQFEKSIAFRNISFAYADSTDEEDLIENASFTLKKGEITAFVGKSGAGKSTLVDIVLGFLQPNGGEILVDGEKMSRQTYAAFCRGVSYIPQEPLLLHASVRENLLCFHPGANEEEMIEALKKAQIWNVIEKLPNQLDTAIGDRGIRLSGGERQRIVLARALMGNPKLLVLDEATSALDYENEKKIRDILIGLKGELTILLVAHRLSTIQSAEHVIVIEHGNVTEDGAYAKLIKNSNGYLGRMINE